MFTKLSIDIGNSTTKLALFDEQILLQTFRFDPKIENLDFQSFVEQICKRYSVRKLILSSVRTDVILNFGIIPNLETVSELNHQTRIPIQNSYQSPETLGKDRIAAAVGAAVLFPKKNCMIADAGTALTLDYVSASGNYLGGTISPGLTMRFKALHDYTQKLPYVSTPSDERVLIGVDTYSAIEHGVVNGILAEIESAAKRFSDKFGEITLILTGGDTFFFEKNIKINTFAVPDLVHIGLNGILDYNA